MNDAPAVIVKSSDSRVNVIEVVDALKAAAPAQARCGVGAGGGVTDRTTTIRAGGGRADRAAAGRGLVVLVIFCSADVSAIIIPSVAVPVSLIGSFGAMYMLGLSLNNVTLMALTISRPW